MYADVKFACAPWEVYYNTSGSPGWNCGGNDEEER